MMRKEKIIRRLARRRRIRARIVGTPEHPRFSVYKSLRRIYAQIIDDAAGRTLVAANTAGVLMEKSQRSERSKKSQKSQKKMKGVSLVSKEAAARLGELIAEKAKKAKITQVVFDRGGYKYHGRIKALADAARAAGLHF
jgi:large subunit ribosomal protein L18